MGDHRQGLSELKENQDMVETTRHELVVGYLCKALAESAEPQPPKPRKSHEEVKAMLRAAREEFQQKYPGRNPWAELIAERRAEAMND